MGSTKASYTEHTVRTLEEHMDKGAFVKIKGPQEEKAGHKVRENTHIHTHNLHAESIRSRTLQLSGDTNNLQ